MSGEEADGAATAAMRLLRLRLSTNRDLAWMHVLLVLLSLLAAALSPRPEWLLPLSGLISAGAWLYRRFHSDRRIGRGCVLEVSADGRIRLLSAGGRVRSGVLGDRHWCGQRMIVLALHIDGRDCQGIVLRSRQSARDFRKLRVWVGQKIRYNAT